MDHSSLSAPWRIEYIRSLEQPAGCFLCEAAACDNDEDARQRLLLWSTPLSVVVINRYPYTNGHLLIAPRAHKAELEELTQEELLDLQVQTLRAIRVLRRAMSPQGFNLGTNLGRCAGAGLPGHVHQHLVPRWNGDTNFMSVVGNARVVPQAIDHLYQELRQARDALSDT